MKSTFSLSLLAASTLVVGALPALAARGGHAADANALPRRRHHARRAAALSSLAATPTTTTEVESAPTTKPVDVVSVAKRAYSTPAGWDYQGCSLDASQRLLTGYSFFQDDMTVDICLTECGNKGYSYGGIEWKTQCFCGDSLSTLGGISVGSLLDSLVCSQTCTDGSPCGGYWAISLFKSTTASSSSSSSAVPSATSTAAALAWPSQGCLVDHDEPRTLQGYSQWSDNGYTPESCISLCKSQGYSVAGIEVNTQCYCSDSAVEGAVIASDDQCDWTCWGDSTKKCGGNWRLSVYSTKSLEEIMGGSSGSTSSSSTSAVTSAASSAASTSNVASSSSTVSSSALSSSVPASSSAAPSSSSSSSSSSSATPTTSAASVSTSAPVSSGSKAVYVHMMVGNTYSFTYNSWLSNIQQASGAGFDGFALNVGSDSWQWSQVASAYQAAAASGTNFKLFLSLDMTVLPCSSFSDADLLKSYVTTYAGHSAQAYYEGKQLLSTFAGSDCSFGVGDWNSGWQQAVKTPLASTGNEIFFIPSVFTDPSTFSGVSVMDGELNWNSAWTSGDSLNTWHSDDRYLAGLGSKAYMAAVAPGFFTHYGPNSWNKNWWQLSDAFYFASRWQTLVENRDKFDLIEALTWNDYGESSYLGPIDGDQPNSQAWVDGFDHTPLLTLNDYYSTAFKTGRYPSITKDVVYLAARPHSRTAYATSDSVGRPTGGQNGPSDGYLWGQDSFFALVFAVNAGQVTLSSGSNTKTVAVSAGVNWVECELQVGSGMRARFNSIDLQPAFTFVDNPATYNFNSQYYSSA